MCQVLLNKFQGSVVGSGDESHMVDQDLTNPLSMSSDQILWPVA